MWILFLLLFCSVANADVYILTDSNNSVIGLSEQNDMVVPSGYKISVVKGNIDNLPINGDPTLYNFDKGYFTLDKVKVQTQQSKQQSDIATQTAKSNMKNSAINKLKNLGLTDDEITSLLLR